MTTKLSTENNEKHQMAFGHKQAMERLFSKKDPSVSGITSLSYQKHKEQSKESARLHGINRYAFEDKVGSGTFGVVHKARDKVTLETVAIKRVFQDKKYKNR